ncbi:MAG: DNA polymerase III subunit delta [Planctomycetaceae bacterium]|nr:DNA polymerase III subunit delta [Planctomycetaceae bacterium]HCK42455.1 DNA polymerase III subunit delta [Planctomycetaceae bacterium]
MAKPSKPYKASPTTALEFLLAAGEALQVPVCAVTGDESFLRHEVRMALKATLGNGEEDALTLRICDGKIAELRDVFDTLCERSLFGSGQRLVVIEEADPFVKKYREQLEDYLSKPMADALLVLEVNSWPANTRLAKAVAQCGLTIRCQVPQQNKEFTGFKKHLKDWLIQLAHKQHGAKLERGAVDVLLDLLPTEVGILCQEVARLALLVEEGNPIDATLVRAHVGGWRVRKTWDMIDAAADGRAHDALDQLDRLIIAGEEPHALLPQMASTLRRFAAAVRIIGNSEKNGRKIPLRAALEQSGMPPFKLKTAERQLRQIGRERASQLYHWLLAADLELKGYNSTKDRARRVLETLIVRLSQQMRPQPMTNR